MSHQEPNAEDRDWSGRATQNGPFLAPAYAYSVIWLEWYAQTQHGLLEECMGWSDGSVL